MSQPDLFTRASNIADALRPQLDAPPILGMILGSGLGGFVDSLDTKATIPFADIPGFPRTTVDGHAGNLVIATIADHPVVIMQGRIHYYEVADVVEATLPVRVLGRLGIRALVVTNSSGALNPRFKAGEMMLIEDQINLMGTNPLMGHNDKRFGPRFPDMSEAYNRTLSQCVLDAAASLGQSLQRGVYVGVTGPSYETPAEVRMLHAMGADAVGMSTVPEIIVANHMGMRCVGVSCLSNMAAGLQTEHLTHEEVKVAAGEATRKLAPLLKEAATRMIDHLK